MISGVTERIKINSMWSDNLIGILFFVLYPEHGISRARVNVSARGVTFLLQHRLHCHLQKATRNEAPTRMVCFYTPLIFSLHQQPKETDYVLYLVFSRR